MFERVEALDLAIFAGLMTAIIIICVLFLRQNSQYKSFREVRDKVDTETFSQGTVIDDVDVSDMDYEDVVAHWENDVEPKYQNATVTLSNGDTLVASEWGYTSDYETAILKAWNNTQNGTLQERYDALTNAEGEGMDIQVTRVYCDEEKLDAYISELAASIDVEAVDSKIESFDVETRKFVFTDEVVGQKLDTEALKRDILAAFENGGGTVTLNIIETQPEITKADVAANYGMISYATTTARGTDDRISNIRTALGYINGTILKPGQTFSFNDTVGRRTSARGFKVATTYNDGEVSSDVGGGICQVSTTLFNAAVKADCEIVERHCHSLVVHYIDKGKDAAVNWDNQDMKFKNTSSDRIVICTRLNDNNEIEIGIFGKRLADGQTITVEGVTTGKIKYETEYRMNPLLPSGTENVLQEGEVGYTAVAYKIYWDKDGNEIRRELLCESSYQATKEIVEYSP